MNIQDAFNKVELFNKIGGNLDVVTPEKVDNQLSLIYEELVETIDALESKDAQELADGVADLFVTVSGLMQMLEVAGFNVETTLNRVAINNLTKFPTEINRGLSEYPEDYTITLNEKYQRFVIKDTNNKIRKPVTYSKVTLDGLINEKFFGEAK